MKKTGLVLLTIMLILSSCSITIPLQTNLSDQTMLLAENKNIKANYTLTSNVQNGFIPYVYVQKNGSETINKNTYEYASETAFKKIWGSYFSNKFNEYSEDEMDVIITLKSLKLKEQKTTSIIETSLTGKTKMSVNAVAKFSFIVKYRGKEYKKEFEVVASEYNESQSMQAGNYYYTANHINPTHQKSYLLENCLNKSIIQFENSINSIIIK